MDINTLRLIIQAKLADGRLPRERRERVWGGLGHGQTCSACEEVISKAQLMMETFVAKGDKQTFHIKCFTVWDEERTRFEGRNSP